MLAADGGGRGAGKGLASQAQGELRGPLPGPSVSPMLPASLALALHLIPRPRGKVRAAFTAFKAQQSQVYVWGDAPSEGGPSCSVLPSCKLPPGKELALVPRPFLTQEVDGKWRRRREEEREGQQCRLNSRRLGVPSVPAPHCLPAV